MNSVQQQCALHHHNKILIESFHLSGHTFRFHLQQSELSSVITQTVPLGCTHRVHLSGHTFRFRWTVQDLEFFLV